MAMDYANACKIVIMKSKLYALRDAAAPSQYPPIDAQLVRKLMKQTLVASPAQNFPRRDAQTIFARKQFVMV